MRDHSAAGVTDVVREDVREEVSIRDTTESDTLRQICQFLPSFQNLCARKMSKKYRSKSKC